MTVDNTGLFRSVEAFYNEAGRVDRRLVRSRLREIPVVEMERFVPKQGTIVDLGCGRGEFANYLSLTGEQRQIFGYDLASDRIRIAQATVKGRPNIRFEVGDIRQVDLPSCNCLILSEVLYLMDYQEQETLLGRCVRSLEPDGVLLVKTWDTRPRWKFVLGGIKTGLIHGCINVSEICLKLLPVRTLRERFRRTRARILGERRARPYFRASEEYIRLFEELSLNVETVLSAVDGTIRGSVFRSPVLYICRKARRDGEK